jgi:protease-4
MKRLLFAIVSVALSANGAQGERLPQPDGIFYYQPAASVFGAEALWVNPAGLSAYRADGIQLISDYRDGDWFKNKGLLLYRQRMALVYRTLEQPFDSTTKEWIVGLGLEMGASIEFGTSYRWISKGPSIYDGQKQWTIGLLRRSGGPVSWGIVIGNLNRHKIGGKRSETELRYSLGYRPLGDKLTLAADALLSTGTRFKNADFVYHAEFTPKAGLFLNGSVDSHRNFELGVRVNLLQNFVGSKSRFNRRGNDRGTTMFVGTTSLRQPSVIPEPPRRLIVPLSSFGAENPAQPVFGRSTPPFVDLILTLYRAGNDPLVREVLIKADGLSFSFAQAQEIRQAIRQLRALGKTVIFHDGSPGNLSYYLASAADRVVIPPVCQVNLVGLRAELTFYAGTMEKLGVHADLVRIGDYKTAAEPFTRTASSEENKAQLNRLLDNLFDQLTKGIAEGRKISQDSVKHLIDVGPFTSQEAKEFGLVDQLAYYADFVKENKSRIRDISYGVYVRDTVTTGSWQSPLKLALVVADGEIVGKYSSGSPLDSDPRITVGTMARAFEQARGDRKVKGIVFRIDSPGGDAVASDAISQSTLAAAKKKPLVVSMGGVAASGGYYVAIPAKRLFADPATITGSIGIFGGKIDMSGLYQKIGLGKELFTRGKYAGWLSTSRPFTEDEREKYLHHLTAFYNQFVGFAASHRGLSADSIDKLGRGRVWTGQEALSNGLIDELGGLWESLEFLRRQTGITGYTVDIYPRRRPLFLFSTPKLVQSFVRAVIGGGSDEDTAGALTGLSSDARVVARLPYDVVIE